MGEKPSVDKLTLEELQQLLYRKKREQRRQRLQRLKGSGRVVEVPGYPSPDSNPVPFSRPPVIEAPVPHPALPPAGEEDALEDTDGVDDAASRPAVQWWWVANKVLLAVEVAAVVGLAAVLMNLFGTSRELNQELAQIQLEEAQSLALPTPTATPIIDVAILPTGHRYVEGRPPEPVESGNIPAHLLPAINAYVPPPIPTPAPEQARRIQIPAIDVDKPIVQGLYDWEQLKKGVAQRIGSAQPGQSGNIVLGAHNDIYGEIFRHLDKLSPGDEIIISTERASYTYIVRGWEIVEPTDVGVMAPTEHASATLISCYPYRVNNKRIVIFADLVTTDS
ncbi:MAG: sortase [Anaerolineae bacterium]